MKVDTYCGDKKTDLDLQISAMYKLCMNSQRDP